MKAVTCFKSSPESPTTLIDIEIPIPTPTGHDILVEIKAISVNPVDTKVKARFDVNQSSHNILGWDAAGIVKAVGSDVSLFKVGDKVFYAGDIRRSGSNAEYQLVDEHIVGHMPKHLDFSSAAALPLTSITAWESLFDRLNVQQHIAGGQRAIVIIGGAGGVGSIAIQLASQLTDLTVVATASREDSKAWCLKMGAHHVIDHTKPMAPQLASLNISPEFVFSTTHTDKHLNDIAEFIAPQGKLVLIDDHANFDIVPFKLKSVSVHWEMMFTRSFFQTTDMIKQHHLLNEIAKLIETEKLFSTLNKNIQGLYATHLIQAHQLIESHQSIGKIVLTF